MIIIKILLFCCICSYSDQDSAELISDSDSELEELDLEEPSTPYQKLVQQFFFHLEQARILNVLACHTARVICLYACVRRPVWRVSTSILALNSLIIQML